MRVTDKRIFDSSQTALAKARERSADAMDQISSGKRVRHPWDDPAAASLAVTHRLAEARHQAIAEGVGRAQDELANADNALDGINNLLVRVNELVVQMSNDTYAPKDRAAAATEVGALYRSAVALLNTQVGGRFLFGGNLDRTPPFDAAGNYLGDTAVRQIEIAPGVFGDASIRADVTIKGVGGGTDVLAALKAAETALATNDLAGIRSSIDSISTGISQVSLARTLGGSHASVLEVASYAEQSAQDAAFAALGNELDADPFEAATALAMAERALEAAVSASAKSFNGPSLLDKL